MLLFAIALRAWARALRARVCVCVHVWCHILILGAVSGWSQQYARNPRPVNSFVARTRTINTVVGILFETRYCKLLDIKKKEDIFNTWSRKYIQYKIHSAIAFIDWPSIFFANAHICQVRQIQENQHIKRKCTMNTNWSSQRDSQLPTYSAVTWVYISLIFAIRATFVAHGFFSRCFIIFFILLHMDSIGASNSP